MITMAMRMAKITSEALERQKRQFSERLEEAVYLLARMGNRSCEMKLTADEAVWAEDHGFGVAETEKSGDVEEECRVYEVHWGQ